SWRSFPRPRERLPKLGSNRRRRAAPHSTRAVGLPPTRSPGWASDGMIRVLFYLIIVAALAFGAVWLAERPGDVPITWQGERIETSVFVLAAAVAAIVVIAVLLWSLVRAIVRSPDLVARYLRTRRGVRGYLAVSQGLVAVGSGDARAARKFSDEAKRI